MAFSSCFCYSPILPKLVFFQVSDENFKAHKLILAAHSPVFKAQFFGLVRDPSMDKVEVKDVEPFIFKVNIVLRSRLKIVLNMH
ncbi:BTB/POZ and MATH domain-containing protein 3 isoform X1 [Ziziphus jujuba]|uniref:BTB/POZ and MATH domain-containing protein 3 isoform X1 n=1 Tax=Ziziphus jujuba TaxID=326968 RepID=A0ABM3ZYN0_ZIZJJ|nr:BTB/POZ and MATH domain-containing protein 3 isoform X1 [Ziziphus jujuba]